MNLISSNHQQNNNGLNAKMLTCVALKFIRRHNHDPALRIFSILFPEANKIENKITKSDSDKVSLS